jgi:hypothetical protein
LKKSARRDLIFPTLENGPNHRTGYINFTLANFQFNFKHTEVSEHRIVRIDQFI